MTEQTAATPACGGGVDAPAFMQVSAWSAADLGEIERLHWVGAHAPSETVACSTCRWLRTLTEAYDACTRAELDAGRALQQADALATALAAAEAAREAQDAAWRALVGRYQAQHDDYWRRMAEKAPSIADIAARCICEICQDAQAALDGTPA